MGNKGDFPGVELLRDLGVARERSEQKFKTSPRNTHGALKQDQRKRSRRKNQFPMLAQKVGRSRGTWTRPSPFESRTLKRLHEKVKVCRRWLAEQKSRWAEEKEGHARGRLAS